MRPISVLLLFLSCQCVVGQQVTTFILIRHAEKAGDMSKDPDLTEEGKQRAARLAKMLHETKVDAIYSTPYKRTQNTVTQLAHEKGMSVQSYEPSKSEAIDEMLRKFPGGTIVVCGHSNTIPWTANYLTARNDIKDFTDADYDNLLIVEVVEKGKAKVVWLEY